MNNTGQTTPVKSEQTNFNTETKERHEKIEYEEDTLVKRRAVDPLGRRVSYREPITHIKNKTLMEILFGSCFGDLRTSLTIEELIPFYDLKNDANTYFDNKCKDYDDMFRELYQELTLQTIEEVQNDTWKTFGFQNANPRSDIRGGGLLSLKQLIYFVKSNKSRTTEMAADNSNFLFAVSSINVTYYLITYYHLSNHLIYSKDKKEICSRVALKSFCSLLRVDNNTLNKIHSLLLNDLYNIWKSLKEKLPKLTLLDFNMAVNIMKAKFVKTTKKHMFDDFEAMSRYYLKLETILPEKRKSFSRK